MNCLKTTLGTLSGVPDHSILQCSGNITNLNPLLEIQTRALQTVPFTLGGCRPVYLFAPQGGVFPSVIFSYSDGADGASDAPTPAPFSNQIQRGEPYHLKL